MPAPMGVVEHGTGKRDHVGFAFCDNGFGLFGRGDQSDGARSDADLTFHLLGKLDIGIGDQGGTRFGADAAGGDADEIEADRLQCFRERDGIVGGEPAFAPIASGDARPERHPLWHRCAHGLRDLERKAHARRERAAISVAAPIGERRDEAVQEIAVGPMELDGVDAGADCALCRLHEALAHTRHVVRRHLPGSWPLGTERNGRWSDRLPWVLSRSQRLTAFPWPLCGGLAPRMGELNAELRGAVTATMGDDTRQRRLAVVRVEPKAAMTDAAAALDARGLDHDQRCAGIGEHAEMIEVPVGGDAIVGTVLAHRRDDDPVREFEIGKPDRRKQGTGHGTRIIGWRGQARGKLEHKEWRDRSEAVANRQLSRTAVRATGTRRDRSESGPAGSSRAAAGQIGNRPGALRHAFGCAGRAQSQPISRSAKWSRACARETALRCNSAATARCDKAPENTRSRRSAKARHFCATSSSACAGCRSDMERAIRSLFTMWVGVGSTRKQRLTAHCYPLCRITHQITADHHNPASAADKVRVSRRTGVRLRRRPVRSGGCMPPKTDPPGRGNPGGSR